MGLVQTVVNALVVGAVGLFLARMTQSLRVELKAEFSSLRAEVRHDIEALRAELKGDIGDLRTDVRELRSDLTRVALAVGAEPRTGSG